MKCFRKMQISLVLVFLIMAVMMLGSTSIIYAAGEIPYTFSPGETISSAQVNANFQALSAKIAELQAQLAPAPPASVASVAGIYDYFLFGTSTAVVRYDSYNYEYRFGRTHYQGTLVLAANGTSKLNGTGGYTQMAIGNIISDLNVTATDPYPTSHKLESLISGTLSTDRPTDVSEATYTVSGSIVTVGGGVFIGTLSLDGKILAGIFKSPYDNDNGTGIMIGIRRLPTITSATSATADGHYNAGASINITLNFSEAVTSTGLTIALNSGATITTGAISNAPSWSGTYTVGTGQTSSDLSIGTITGTITSVFSTFSTSNPMPPSGMNIGDSKAIVIE